MQTPETEIIVTKDGREVLRKTVRPGDYVIGREADCDVPVEVDLVSRRHAQLTINYDHALIEDLGSSNGTFVNGQPVTESTRLWPNQKIQVGAATIELHRIKTVPPPDESLAPTTAAIQRLLPEEFLKDKKYDIGKVVAQGGMGAILDAKDATTERRVAMKVMLDGSSPDDLIRFVAEAKVTAQLEHPSIVPVYELSVDENGQVFYTMKMVRGITLRKVLELLAQGVPETVKKYPLPVLLTIFQKVCDAIGFAHSKGVIHRDLKPENIMLDDFGVVLVMDWGLAKVIGQGQAPVRDVSRSAVRTLPPEASGATLAGTVMGTPQYMSPEQARGEVETLDVRSDIYALGTILYHILTLRPPVAGNDAWAIVAKVAKGEFDPLTAPKTRTIPDSIAAVTRKAMAFEKEQRYPNVADLQRDIEAYQNGRATRAENASVGKQLVLLVKRHKALFSTVAAAWLIITSLAVWFVINLQAGEKRTRIERDRAEGALSDLKATAPNMLALAASEAAAQNFESALNNIDAALKLDPNLTAAYWRRGWILFAQEKLPEAIIGLRLAADKEPANKHFAELIPLVEKMNAAQMDKRHNFEIIKPLYDHLTSVGAVGESTPLIPYLKLANEARLALVRERVERWLGKTSTDATKSLAVALNHGEVAVNLRGLHIGNLDPLRGLPIDMLLLESCGLTNLEPLRGMRLVKLEINDNSIEDLSPLQGMPLETLTLHTNPGIKDLSPLAGMPLKHFEAQGERQLHDIRPLAGMPLEFLNIDDCPINDFSALRGMPLQYLAAGRTHFADGRVLTGMPLTTLELAQTGFSDTTTLVGLPLRILQVGSCPISDFTPLLRIPTLESLETNAPIEKLLPLRAHPGLKEIRCRSASYRPVADFWKEYDAQHPASPK